MCCWACSPPHDHDSYRGQSSAPALSSELVASNSLKPEKAMAPHSSTLAWKIPWMEEPGRLQSMGSLRVRHDWVTSLSLFTFMHWRRKWQPTPVFLPGESQGQRSLAGCRLWDRTESDTTEVMQQQQQQLPKTGSLKQGTVGVESFILGEFYFNGVTDEFMK